MSSKTFFFREDYSIKEMEERIFAQDFIKVFKGFADFVSDEEDIEVNKLNCFRGLMAACSDDFDRLKQEMKSCFNAYGRHGDKLNIKLFVIEEFNYSFNGELRTKLIDLIDNERNIKMIDSLSQGLKDNIFLEAYNENNNKLDLKFRIEQFYLNTSLTVPKEEIKNIFIECRIYLNTGIVSLFNPNGTYTISKSILSITHLLFKGHSPRFYEVKLDEAQLIAINLRLNGQISSPKFSSKDELKIEIYGLNPTNQENPLVTFVGDSNLEIFELSTKAVIQGHSCTVKINADGKIQIETFVTPDVLDRIILDLDWVIFTQSYYKEYRIQLDKLLKQVNRGSLSNRRNRKIKEVEEEFARLINTHTHKTLFLKELKLITTVVYNIGIKINDSNMYNNISNEICENNKNHISEYSDTLDVFSKHLVINNNLNKREADEKALYILSLIYKLVYESNGDVVKIIDDFEEWLKCQTTSIQEVR